MKTTTKDAARIARLTRKGLTKREARNVLGRLPGGTDWLAHRRPFADTWRDETRYGRAEVLAEAKASLRAFATDKFWHYGPRFAIWPGEVDFY